jgi:tetratricopeptide (TPR) repeat protein
MEQVHSYTEQEHATDVAFHLQRAGASADARRTAHFLALAGDRALAAAAFENALQQYESALALLPADDRAGRADLLFKRGLALRGVARWDEALDDWRQTVSIYAGLRDTDAIGRTYAIVCQQLLWAPRLIEALELSQRGLAILGKRVSAGRCMLLTVGGLALSLAGFYAAADRMISQAISLAEQLENRALLGKVIGFRAVHHYCYAQLREQLEAGQKATELLRSVGDLWDLADALWVTQIALVGLGRFEESERMGEELEPLAERLGHVGAQLVALRCRGIRGS